MLPDTWHFPVAWREEELGDDGHVWIYRQGLAWSAYGPKEARIAVEEED